MKMERSDKGDVCRRVLG
uniref:Uncharacterized protein n=1 Tax=Anguilla anguilla TaxID=7936 RepID=A0A0E9PE79_ANGAN